MPVFRIAPSVAENIVQLTVRVPSLEDVTYPDLMNIENVDERFKQLPVSCFPVPDRLVPAEPANTTGVTFKHAPVVLEQTA
ncbi:MAG: hypothetical protein M1442_03415 [Candidatus Thermoplasmatota archaeon]|nr:hypothetical protein [Candidatus Thermoplasmatota archaeon]